MYTSSATGVRNPGLRPPRILVSLHHRLRQLAAGAYTQAPFQFSAFTLESPDSRVTRAVPAPRGRWRTPA